MSDRDDIVRELLLQYGRGRAREIEAGSEDIGRSARSDTFTGRTPEMEMAMTLRGIGSLARPDRFIAAMRGWPASTNIEDRRGDYVDPFTYARGRVGW